jgi:hypothetical protein
MGSMDATPAVKIESQDVLSAGRRPGKAAVGMDANVIGQGGRDRPPRPTALADCFPRKPARLDS